MSEYTDTPRKRRGIIMALLGGATAIGAGSKLFADSTNIPLTVDNVREHISVANQQAADGDIHNQFAKAIEEFRASEENKAEQTIVVALSDLTDSQLTAIRDELKLETRNAYTEWELTQKYRESGGWEGEARAWVKSPVHDFSDAETDKKVMLWSSNDTYYTAKMYREDQIDIAGPYNRDHEIASPSGFGHITIKFEADGTVIRPESTRSQHEIQEQREIEAHVNQPRQGENLFATRAINGIKDFMAQKDATRAADDTVAMTSPPSTPRLAQNAVKQTPSKT
jgi:hypothetical protein